MEPRLQRDPGVRANRAYPLASRLFVGALKNLLAGVTTVAHHNPRYREMGRRFPVRVVRRYGWAHSFFSRADARARAASRPDSCTRRFRATPSGAPFIMHLAEGTDDDGRGGTGPARGDGLPGREQRARARRRLERPRLGADRAAGRGARLVSRRRTRFSSAGRCAAARFSAAPSGQARVCLGTDSRLTGSRDLLDELRAAAPNASPDALLPMVTTTAADVLRLRREPGG